MITILTFEKSELSTYFKFDRYYILIKLMKNLVQKKIFRFIFKNLEIRKLFTAYPEL